MAFFGSGQAPGIGSLRPPAAPQEHPQEPLATSGADAALLRGVAEVHQKVISKKFLEAARKAVFVLDDVLPMSFVPPPSWGAVRTRWVYRYKGLPVESLTFENDNTIKRATARVHGHD